MTLNEQRFPREYPDLWHDVSRVMTLDRLARVVNALTYERSTACEYMVDEERLPEHRYEHFVVICGETADYTYVIRGYDGRFIGSSRFCLAHLVILMSNEREWAAEWNGVVLPIGPRR